MKIHILIAALFGISALGMTAMAAVPETEKEVTLLFTHDNHDYYYPTSMISDNGRVSHGGAARLATILKDNTDDHSIYVDAGDFSMGTFLQAAYTEEALELRILGELGCSVSTFGNHEFDYGAHGVSQMLLTAVEKGEKLPELVCSNYSFEGELTEDQKVFQTAVETYGVQDYTIKEINGVNVAFMGFMGHESVEDAPTSGQNWIDYIDSAKEIVKKIGDQADVIVALSHSGTDGDREEGEDIDLAKNVPEIDVIISSHSHSTYQEPVMVGDTILVSSGCYLQNCGKLSLEVSEEGVSCKAFELIPINETVPEDPEMKQFIQECVDGVNDFYVSSFGYEMEQELAYIPYDFESLEHMYETHREYPMGDLIADSYLYKAEKEGITDIDVAIVGLGTIRDTFEEGVVTTADVFESCSLGVGADGSAGHPIIAAYITGKELKLLAELDASLGPMVSSIKMSYSGLEYTFNEKRMILDRVTEIHLVRNDGTKEEIEDGKLYKVCCNMYAANMLGMLNNLTKGILSISIKNENGVPVLEKYDYTLHDKNGKEIKEWVCLADYLTSFPIGTNNLPELPDSYQDAQGRKNKISSSGLDVIVHPGLPTIVVMIVPVVLVGGIVIIVYCIKKRKKKRN